MRDARLDFFLVDNEWAYADDTHQLVISAGLPNTTHKVYSGVLILASLLHNSDGSDGAVLGGGVGGSSTTGNVTAHFSAQTFTSQLSIMESLGCFTGTSSSAREHHHNAASSSSTATNVSGAAAKGPTRGEALAGLGLDGSVLGFNTTIARRSARCWRGGTCPPPTPSRT